MKLLLKLTSTVLSVMFFAACDSSSVKENSQANVPVKPESHIVEIVQMKFNPSELTVNKGDTVIFVNHDLLNHDVTEESSKEWTSSQLTPEQTFSLVVTKSTSYYCSLHPVMRGRIMIH